MHATTFTVYRISDDRILHYYNHFQYRDIVFIIGIVIAPADV